MGAHSGKSFPVESFQTHPSQYKHWKLSFDAENPSVATLAMDVNEDAGLGDYVLKLNSYDLSVDIELADAVQRLRFEHPAVKCVVVTSNKPRIFCAGANIRMLGQSSHAFKVNFCKYTNETRLGLEDATDNSGIQFLCALNGTASGGGYELALACGEIMLIDDASSAVSLPEVPLLGVLPGTGGLTRVVDKRKVRRDLADAFSTIAEGVRGKRSVEWRLVDSIAPKTKWEAAVKTRAAQLAAQSPRPTSSTGKGITLDAIVPDVDGHTFTYRHVVLQVDPKLRLATITVAAPKDAEPKSAEKLQQRGADAWVLRAFRELDDAILRLRFNYLDVGLINLRTEGDEKRAAFLLETEQALLDAAKAGDWFAGEVLHHMKRVFKRLDVTSRTLMTTIEPSSCFVGCLAELALIADRSYMLDDSSADVPARIVLSPISLGALPMGNGLTRLQARYYGDAATLEKLQGFATSKKDIEPSDAEKLGVVTFVRDEIDYPDETRLFMEERASLSPDALVGMEANLRFVGPETMETRIFGRLSAWQNWIFIRENATGEQGALTNYGQPQRPVFDWQRC